MIVCICEGLSDREIRAEIQRGCGSIKDLTHRCGAGASCGGCRGQLRDMFGEQRASARSDDELLSESVVVSPDV